MRCTCGCQWFSATRVTKKDVVISSDSDAEYSGDVFEEYLEDEVQCTECGRAYTLDQVCSVESEDE